MREFLFAHFPRLMTAMRALRGYNYVLLPPDKFVVQLEYPIRCAPRWGHGRPPNSHLAKIIGRDRNVYDVTLRSFLPFADELVAIPADADPSHPNNPNYVNGWLPDLDAIAIYAFLAQQERRLYLEVGSGNSTKFARKAIATHGRRTRVVSIDPSPRAEIDILCDEVIRSPLKTSIWPCSIASATVTSCSLITHIIRS